MINTEKRVYKVAVHKPQVSEIFSIYSAWVAAVAADKPKVSKEK